MWVSYDGHLNLDWLHKLLTCRCTSKDYFLEVALKCIQVCMRYFANRQKAIGKIVNKAIVQCVGDKSQLLLRKTFCLISVKMPELLPFLCLFRSIAFCSRVELS